MQPLLGAARGVDHPVVDGHRPRQHLEQRHLPDELVGDGAEHVGQRLGRRVGRDVDLDGAVAAAGGHRPRPVGRRRAELADEVGQPVDADAGRRRTAQDGELDAAEHLVGQRPLQLVGAGHVAGQVPLELLVVAGHDLLDQLVVQAVLLVGDVGRQRLAVVAAVGLVLEALVGEDVGDAVEALLLAERQLERDEARPEPLPELRQHAVEVGARLVLLVDEDEPGDAGGGALAPGRLGADLDAVDGADHDDGQVGDRQRGVDVADEVGVARACR